MSSVDNIYESLGPYRQRLYSAQGATDEVVYIVCQYSDCEHERDLSILMVLKCKAAAIDLAQSLCTAYARDDLPGPERPKFGMLYPSYNKVFDRPLGVCDITRIAVMESCFDDRSEEDIRQV